MNEDFLVTICVWRNHKKNIRVVEHLSTGEKFILPSVHVAVRQKKNKTKKEPRFNEKWEHILLTLEVSDGILGVEGFQVGVDDHVFSRVKNASVIQVGHEIYHAVVLSQKHVNWKMRFNVHVNRLIV